MTFPVWLEIVCARCAHTTSGQYTYKGNIPVRIMKNEAKSQGWTFNYNDAFCCKECEQKYSEEQS